MADSDDEYDRKRRDKFRGERSEANYRGTERSVRPRDDWQDRYGFSLAISYIELDTLVLQKAGHYTTGRIIVPSDIV